MQTALIAALLWFGCSLACVFALLAMARWDDYRLKQGRSEATDTGNPAKS